MNARNKSGQLTFRVTIESAKKTKPKTPVLKPDSDVRAVKVLPDVPAIDKTFDYSVPHTWIEDGRSQLLKVGSMVRMPFRWKAS